jgi:hypothetical protein
MTEGLTPLSATARGRTWTAAGSTSGVARNEGGGTRTVRPVSTGWSCGHGPTPPAGRESKRVTIGLGEKTKIPNERSHMSGI